MTRGRRPKPTALKRAAGNPGKRALNHAELQPPEGLPTCPPHLSDVAREEWDRVARVLYEMGVLTVVDRAGLAAYCQAYATWWRMERDIEENGDVQFNARSGLESARPQVAMRDKALDTMRRFLVEFGLTPSSRTRVSAAETPKAEDSNPFARLAGG